MNHNDIVSMINQDWDWEDAVPYYPSPKPLVPFDLLDEYAPIRWAKETEYPDGEAITIHAANGEQRCYHKGTDLAEMIDEEVWLEWFAFSVSMPDGKERYLGSAGRYYIHREGYEIGDDGHRSYGCSYSQGKSTRLWTWTSRKAAIANIKMDEEAFRQDAAREAFK